MHHCTIFFIINTFFISRRIKLEVELAEMSWKVRYEDIIFGTPRKPRLERSGSHV